VVYTGKGDGGETGIVGRRVSKDCITMEVVGEIDELISLLGIIASELESAGDVERIISDLMGLNAHIASEGRYRFRGDASWLEERIDELRKEVGDLNCFVLRFTDRLAAEMHHARAVCRRAERELVRFSRDVNWLDPKILAYVNRLSDYLFVLARWTNKRKGGTEILWN